MSDIVEPNSLFIRLNAPYSAKNNFSVKTHLLVSFDLTVRTFHNGEVLPLSQRSIRYIRQLELILCEISNRLIHVNCAMNLRTLTVHAQIGLRVPYANRSLPII